ncbi:MAG TPA: hypothetical protein VFA32_23825 [Dehalococcoidia bacterium]|nr:hypothetical protein [Dehalococcoidia bacterium]
MAMIDEVQEVCNRLAGKGWSKLLLKHGLDITKSDLRAELDRELPQIDRTVPGFEDFAAEGRRGIEPGNPNRSLLYHALASPNVVEVDGGDLVEYPTLRDLEIVENYVFGAKPPSLQELSALAAGDLMAVVVFASEYRPAVDTVHRKHAELCFSRTGIARVGNEVPLYEARSRGFTPFKMGSDDQAFHVLPARYSAWIAVQRSGSGPSFGPIRFDFRSKHPEFYRRPGDPPDVGDGNRKFWVPLHKLFSGDECLQGHTLEVTLQAHHVNEKIRRIHLELARRGHSTGWTSPDIDEPPFRFTDGIAEFSMDPAYGGGLLVPIVHAFLVEPAQYQGQPLTFTVPPTSPNINDWSPTLEIQASGRTRHAPEYVHVRHVPGGDPENLNDLENSNQRVWDGNYRALHYVDYSADGWIEPVCPQLNPELPRFIAAYSIVAAPDFFFSCDQREVMDWWLERAPTSLRDFLWGIPPLALSDERVAPNLKLNNIDFRADDLMLPRANFRPEDDTVTTIVSMPVHGDVQQRPLKAWQRDRHTWLPDTAAGIFAPGWDTSMDTTGDVSHLAAYGLGSPFPEDSKLCAALSTFWPAVAPDAGRSFSRVLPTVSPLTDEEIGRTGLLPWDGVPGPRLVQADGEEVAEYASFDHVDYVENALQNRFSLALTGRIQTREYVMRVLAMARAYLALGVSNVGGKRSWNVLSFRPAPAEDAERKVAEEEAGRALGGTVFRFEMYKPALAPAQPADHRKIHWRMRDRTVLFVDGTSTVLLKTGSGPWLFKNV